MRDLTDSVVAITGASAGIGAATAVTLVDAGARVVLGARRTGRLEEMVDKLGGDRAVGVSMDVRSPADNARLVQTAIDRFGGLDSMVANAGIGAYGGILDVADDQLREMMDVNFAGTVWAVRAAVPHLVARGGGDLVIVSSVAGLRGGADQAVYAGTKFAQVGLADSLDKELREKGVRVSAICPAGVDTEFALGAGRTPGEPKLADYLRAEDVAHAIRVVLEQPRTMRTTLWSMWSMRQGS